MVNETKVNNETPGEINGSGVADSPQHEMDLCSDDVNTQLTFDSKDSNKSLSHETQQIETIIESESSQEDRASTSQNESKSKHLVKDDCSEDEIIISSNETSTNENVNDDPSDKANIRNATQKDNEVIELDSETNEIEEITSVRDSSSPRNKSYDIKSNTNSNDGNIEAENSLKEKEESSNLQVKDKLSQLVEETLMSDSEEDMIIDLDNQDSNTTGAVDRNEARIVAHDSSSSDLSRLKDSSIGDKGVVDDDVYVLSSDEEGNNESGKIIEIEKKTADIDLTEENSTKEPHSKNSDSKKVSDGDEMEVDVPAESNLLATTSEKVHTETFNEKEITGSSDKEQNTTNLTKKTDTSSSMEIDDNTENTTNDTLERSSSVKRKNTSGGSSGSDISDDENPHKSDLTQLASSIASKRPDLQQCLEPETNGETGGQVKGEDIICLDDDDEVKIIPKPAAALNCVNPNCMSGEDLAKPALFVLTYFGLKRSKGQQVCAECFNIVAEHQMKLVSMLQEGVPLMDATFPNFRDVILLDSDEENDTDDEGNLSDDTMSMIRKNIDDVIIECMDKVDFMKQIQDSADILNDRFDKLKEEVKELNDGFDERQKNLDRYRRLIYEQFAQPIHDIGEVHYNDCEIPPMPIISNSVQDQLYNQELVQALKKKNQQELRREEIARQRAYAQKTKDRQISLGIENVQDVIQIHSSARYDPPRNLPPPGPLVRPKLKVGDIAYSMKISYFSVWQLVRVLEVIPRNTSVDDSSTEMYRVKFEQLKKTKTVTGKYLAYRDPAKVQLKVGTRVIAIFKDEDEGKDKVNFYVGIVAEPPKTTNRYRYLVFFDDGYTQYCPHENIRMVCDESENVWEDMHPEPREFIKKYIQQYPERPMVKLTKGQIVRVEWMGKWWVVKVLEVDGSLVKVHFNADNRTEWIYRGSTRLGPMYQELAAAKERQSGNLLRSRGFGSSTAHKTQDGPYVEYTRGDNEEKKGEDKDDKSGGEENMVAVRSVARKSTAKKPEPVISNVPYTKPLVNQVPYGKVTQRLLKKARRPMPFRPHQCSTSCVTWTGYSPERGRKYDPLLKPIMFGFERLSMNYRGRSLIFYRSPCGRMIRSQQEMLCYLQGTKSELTIDMFDFDFWVNVLSEFKEAATFCRIEDLSYGKENVPISCVNELDHSMPQYVEYLTSRQPTKDVTLNLDTDFLVGCDCTDQCEDRSKCSCWQLTMEGKAYLPDGELDPLFGYQHRRLNERVATGIYECNSKCKCSSACQNRVAQQPLSCRLQLFKTLKKGWGIRCLHDIPRGAFICIYAGYLLTDQEANEGGKTYGDEYLAELDYIESVEGLKQGYESEAREMSDAEDEEERAKREMLDDSSQDHSSHNSDNDYNMDDENYKNTPGREDIRLRLRRRNLEESEKESRKSRTDDDSVSVSDDDTGPSRQPQTFNASIQHIGDEEDSEYPSVRDLFGPNEKVFIMDAKTHGNIGRYLNHSCSPNVFVQNVFVDTHDLRFPWVAFFASQYIPAGQELTWDYNYDVGSVPGKVMHCYCGSVNCRGRLL